VATPDNPPASTTASGTATTATTAATHGPDQAATDGNRAAGHASGVKPVVVPFASVFSIKERVILEFAVPNAIQAYKKRSHGQVPATHHEFMRDVISRFQVELPDPPPGHKYLYDPAKEELELVLEN
jgi:hypothetical protein